MKQAYVVTENKRDLALIEKLLSEEFGSRVGFVAGEGSDSAETMARSLLVSKHVPVVLVLDSDTSNAKANQERRETVSEYLGSVTSDAPYEVVMAVPELETVFFKDTSVLEHIINRSVSKPERQTAEFAPKRVLAQLLETDSEHPMKKAVSLLTKDSIAALREHPIIHAMRTFLNRTLAPKPTATYASAASARINGKTQRGTGRSHKR